MHKIFRSRVVAVVTGALVVVGLGTTSGYAAAQITTAQIANNTILANDVAAEAIRSNEVLDGSLRQRDLAQSVQDQIAQPGPMGPAGPQGIKGEPGDPASDVNGTLSASGASAGLVQIAKIGGTFSTNATQLFTVDLPEAGTYLLNTYGYFDRINEGAVGYEVPNTDTYLQLTVRGGGSLATCFTPAVSPRGFTETTCDASSIVTVDGPTDLTVRGFGYNEDRSGFGGTPNSATPQFSAFASLSAVKVG